MLKIKLNDFMHSRNLGGEFNERQAPNKLEFNTGRSSNYGIRSTEINFKAQFNQ